MRTYCSTCSICKVEFLGSCNRSAVGYTHTVYNYSILVMGSILAAAAMLPCISKNHFHALLLQTPIERTLAFDLCKDQTMRHSCSYPCPIANHSTSQQGAEFGPNELKRS